MGWTERQVGWREVVCGGEEAAEGMSNWRGGEWNVDNEARWCGTGFCF